MKSGAVHSIRTLGGTSHKDTSGVRTLCMTVLAGLLLSTCLATPASADCPAAPLASADDMVVSFIASQGGTQAAPSTLFASSVKEGMLVYDDTNNALKLCDGTNWVALQAGTTLAAGTVTGAVQFRGPTGLLTADDTNFIWDDTNNRLGIGTATPSTFLHVTGPQGYLQRWTGGTATAFMYEAIGGGFEVGTAGAYPFSIDTNSVRRLFVSGTGNVGIGTVSPNASALLDMTSTAQGFLPPRMSTTDVGNIATPADGLIVYDTTTDTLKLRANGAWSNLAFGAGGGGGSAAAGNAGEVQFNDGSGGLNADSNLFWNNTTKRLGVGTNTPDAKLDLSGMSPTEAGLLLLADAPDAAAVDHLIAGFTIADRSFRITSERQGGSRNNFIMHNMHYDGTDYTQENWGGSSMIKFSGGHILFFGDAQDTGGSNTAITPTARLAILESGDIGIGVTSPDAKLEVAGGVKIGDDTGTCPGSGNVKLGTLRFNSGNFEVCQSGGWAAAAGGASGVGGAGYVQISDGSGGLTTSGATAGQEFFWDNTNKRLGIGTVAPRGALDVTGGALRLKAGAPANDLAALGLAFEDNGDTGLFMTNHTAPADGDLNLYVNAQPAMTILGSGTSVRNIGIGTTSPVAKLDVSGGVKIGNDADACPGSGNAKVGTLRYASNSFDICGTSGWVSVASGALVTGSVANPSASSAATIGAWTNFPGTPVANLPSAGTYFITSHVYFVYGSGCADVQTRWDGANILYRSLDSKWQACGNSGINEWEEVHHMITVSGATTLNAQYYWSAGAGTTVVFGGASFIKLDGGGSGGGGSGDMLADGSVPMTGDLDMDGNDVIGAGAIGVGTDTPVAALDVVGGVKLGDQTTCTNGTHNGTLRYNSGNLELCGASGWVAVGSGSGSGGGLSANQLSGATVTVPVGSNDAGTPGQLVDGTKTSTAPNFSIADSVSKTIQFQLSSAKEINVWKIYNANGGDNLRLTGVSIYASSDGTNWQQLSEQSYPGGVGFSSVGGPVYFAYTPVGQTYAYYQMRITGASNYRLTWYEVEGFTGIDGGGSSGSTTPAGTDGQIQFNESSALQADAALHWDNTNKRLGIGTATPYGQFQLTAAGQPAFLMESTAGTATQKVGRLVYDGGGAVPGGGFVFQRMTDAGAFNANLMTIVQATGNVGIGTIGPVAKLDVSGGVKIGDQTTCTNGTHNGTLRYNSGALQICQSSGWVNVGGSSGPYLRLAYSAASLNRANVIPFSVSESGGGATWASNRYTASVAGLYFATANIRANGQHNMIITIRKNGSSIMDSYGDASQTGKQGGASGSIVTYLNAGDYIDFYYNHDTAGVYLLTAYASIAYLGSGSGGGSGGATPAGTDGQIQFNESSALQADAALHWDNTNKRLGIGTATPAHSLHVAAPSGSASIQVGQPGTDNAANSQINFVSYGGVTNSLGSASSKGWQVLARSNAFSATAQQNDLMFYYWDGSGWTHSLSMDVTGDVGIGTTDPVSKLDVNGGVKIGDQTTCTNGTHNGTLRYNSGSLEICQSTGWTTVGSGSGNNVSPTVSFSGGGTLTVTLANNIPLYINNTHDAWSNYSTLPSYLVGTRGTDTVNGTPDGSAVTLTVTGGPAVCYQLRNESGWAPVDTTGWSVKETVTAFGPGIDMIRERVFQPGSYTLDSFSAMYACSTAPVGGGTPGGSSTQVQFNDGGSFNGDAALVWDNTNKRLGIGTASPDYPLSVDAGSDQRAIYAVSSNTSATDLQLSNTSLGGHTWGIGSTGSANASPGSLTFFDSTANKTGLFVDADTLNLQITSGGTFAFSSNASYAANSPDTGISRLVANKIAVGNGTQGDYSGTLVAGNVGIGTATPGSPLQVLTANDYDTASFESSGAEVNVGFKSTSTDGRDYRLVSGGSTGGFAGGKFGIYDATASAIRMVVDSSGNIGIGTTSPSAKLDVRNGVSLQSTLAKATFNNYDGDVSTSFNISGAASSDTRLLSLHASTSGTQGSALNGAIFEVYGHNGTNFVNVISANNSGNLGVGIGTPVAKLDVAGGVKIGDQTTCTNGTHNGTLRYNSGNLELCGASGWVGVSSGSSTGQMALVTGANMAIGNEIWDKLDLASASINVGSIVDTTNERITPTEAGYYMVSLTVQSMSAMPDQSRLFASIRKNGSAVADSYGKISGPSSDDQTTTAVTLLYLDGDDYLEAFGYHKSGSTQTLKVTNFSVARVGAGSGGGGGATPAGTDGQIQFNESSALQADAALHWDNTNKRLGIGTGTPGNDLTILQSSDTQSSAGLAVYRNNGSSRSVLFQGGDDHGYLFNYGSGGWQFYANQAHAMSILGNGNVGIGTASPAEKLSVWGNILMKAPAPDQEYSVTLAPNNSGERAKLYITGSNGNHAGHLQLTNGDSDITSADIRMRNAAGTPINLITNSGNSYFNGGKVGIGTTTPAAPLEVAAATGTAIMCGRGNGQSNCHIDAYNPGSGTRGIYLNYFTGTGVYLTGGTSVTSDARIKKNIQPLARAMEKLQLVRGVTFQWKDEKRGNETQVGVIAQEVQKAFPELVKDDGYGTLTVQYSGLVAPLIEAVKELKADNDNLRTELQAANDNYATDIDALRATVEEQGREIEQLKAAQ